MLERQIHALPCWAGAIEIQPLHGGLSNVSFLVSDSAGRHVVRFGADFPFHHVSRERELMVARAAQAAGFAPQVTFAQPGVMVSRYIGAKTFDAQDVRENAGRIASFVRSFHEQMPRRVIGPGYMFWVFHVIRDYARMLNQAGARLAAETPNYVALADELEAAQAAMPIVFGHNDLLPANFLDDGERLWLIDFEYAGFGTAMFDLAGIASNAGMDEDQSTLLLEAYLDGRVTPELRKAHSAMQCASLLREAMWGMVSEINLDTPGVDYVAYAEENLARLHEALDNHRSKYGKSA